jgi:hypothetical protein
MPTLSDFFHRTLGEQLLSKIMIQVLRAVLELGSVRRAPGQSGDLDRYAVLLSSLIWIFTKLLLFSFITSIDRDGIPVYRYLNSKEKFTQWATSLVIQYDVGRDP